MAIYVRKESSTGDKPPLSGESRGPTTLQIELADGAWKAEWINPTSGAVIRRIRVDGGGVRTLEAPPFEADIALRLKRQ